MNVHLFGGIWLPICCPFALKRAATDFADYFGSETIKTILRNFYEDYNLRSLPFVPIAIKLVHEIHMILGKAGFNLTKWLNNNREAVETIPVDNRAGVN